MSETAEGGPTGRAPRPPAANSVDRFFKISARGSTFAREIRGGFATFFTMAYILVLNPIILGSAKDKFGHQLDGVQLVTATALVAAVMTVIMGVGGNLPLALAAGLGLNAVVAFQIAPLMSWDDAMGLIVLEGLLICVLVRHRPARGRHARRSRSRSSRRSASASACSSPSSASSTPGSSPASRTSRTRTVPVQLGGTGTLAGWPVLVFCLGVLLTIALLARKVQGRDPHQHRRP